MPLTKKDAVDILGLGAQTYTAEASLGGNQPTAVTRVRITPKRAPRARKGGA